MNDVKKQDEYHSRRDGSITRSQLCLYDKTPAHFKHRYDNPEESTDSPAFKFGRLAHIYILEESTFHDQVITEDYLLDNRPEQDKGMTSKLNKAYKLEILETGKEIVSEADMKKFVGMKQALIDGGIYDKLIQDGGVFESEHQGEINAVEIRIKTDYWNPEKKLIVDYKTSTDADPDKFERDSYNYLYHVQAAIYKEVAKAENFVFLVQEKTAPYAFSIFNVDNDVLDFGMVKVMELTDLHKECVENDEWPGYYTENKMRTLNLPSWAI